MAEGKVSLEGKEVLENEAIEEFTDGMTMVDFLQEEERLEENVRAVLGGSDDRNCTYSMGYVKRQALYSCLTCIPASSKAEPAGICLACSFSCHDKHDLVELYTKRNFRCDCGNSRYPNKSCNLLKDKDALNIKNKYNHNFVGTYCSCRRPYPDPDVETEEMIQCVICEDWYHTVHLGSDSIPDHYAEMVCRHCVSKHSFLSQYGNMCASGAEEQEADKETVLLETQQRHDDQKNGVATCPLVSNEKMDVGTMFMSSKWRNHLCRCASCIVMYEENNVSFLLDCEDQVLAYEDKGLMENGKPRSSQYEQGMEALSSMNRTDVIEAVQGYNNMKDELKNYLKRFADNKKVVREEDIHEFFSGMQARKKQRVELPYFCR